MKKFILILATVTLLNSNVFAANISDINIDNNKYTEIMPQNIAIINHSRNLTISSGKASCYGYTKTQSGYKAKVTVELQRQGTTWTTIKTWTALDSAKAVVDETYSVSSGYSYRLKTTHYALNSSGSVVESTVKYSSTVSY